MQWIDERDLETWAKRLDARALLADLVADLIRATITDASRFRFPGGDVGEVRGWDGDLETTEARGRVPAQRSKWEFGVGGGAAKATSDYRKRTKQASAEEMAQNTLVLVNLQPWNTPKKKIQDWEQGRREEKKWKDVRYIDAVELVHWLDKHPVVAARYARKVLNKAPNEGALSTDEYWDEFSLQFKPRLHEKVVIADRQKTADELLARLQGKAQSILLGAETSEEVVAFAVAAIRTAAPETRRLLESKTFIIRTEQAARFLSNHDDLVFIVTGKAESLAGVLGDKCPTLSATTGVQARRHMVLPRASANGMADGFVAMGLEYDEGYELGHRCGRSLTILKRLTANGAVPVPEWLPHVVTLKPVFLAGGWHSAHEMDRSLLLELSGHPNYGSLESALLPTLALADRPIDKSAEVWQARAPVDAFYFYGGQVSSGDLENLKAAVLKVFSMPATLPSREQKFRPDFAAPQDYSKWLRDGLSLTLLIIATMHDIAGMHVSGTTPQQYVNDIVSSLPEWGKKHQSLLALSEQAMLFAEAAPSPFLMALESMLEGAPAELDQFFVKEGGGVFGPSSPHVPLLWSLEVIAWDPRYLSRAAIVLAKLAEHDPEPDSNFTNRPLNSLRDILLGWSPNTYAPQVQRIACLDVVLQQAPDIGWQLLTKLLPRPHDTSSPTQHPKLRDPAPKEPEVITFGLVWDFEAAVVTRALTAAADDEKRLCVLMNTFATFRPENRALVLKRVDEYLTDHQTETGCQLWRQLESEAARHDYFSDAEWALSDDDLAALKDVVERHRPADPLISERRLFDNWMPHVGKYQPNEDPIEDPETIRRDVLQRVLDRDGVTGIMRLARMVNLPNLIGPNLRQTSITYEQLFELLALVLTTDAPRDLAFYISAIGAEKFGDRWKSEFKERALKLVDDPGVKASLFLGWPLNPSTWAYVESLGSEVRQQYWRQISALPTDGSLDDLLFAISQFQTLGRHIEALRLVHNKRKDVPTAVLLDLLSKGVRQANEALQSMGNMLPYYIEQTLAELRGRSDVTEETIAKLEYAYFPLFRYEDKPLTVIRLLGKNAALFVEVLSHVFRGKSAPADEEITSEMKAHAETSYALLSAFKTVPGLQDGKVDFSTLSAWVQDARARATAIDLSNICDQYIGHVLAHAPNDPGESSWPASAVCMLIESVAATHIEQGFAIECFNKRGAFSKALHEGGDQERALAARYKAWSDSALQYPRTSAVLLSISENWLEHAMREDTRAEQSKLKM